MIQKPIVTNIITGFLGVGKTSLIKHLLASKPESEVWAVLVNEFGEVGIDAGLINSNQDRVQIREVAGGCMCCAAGVPMQVALNQLITKAKPDRLLIEPTGLGHPQEVIRVLTEPHFQNVIAMKACVTLVDARKVKDARYTENEIFNQQLRVADLLLAAKHDLYEANDLASLQDYLCEKELGDKPCLPYSSINAPETEPLSIMTLLNAPRKQINETRNPQTAPPGAGIAMRPLPVFDERLSPDAVDYDERGIMVKQNKAEGYFSCGWVFEPSYEFQFDAILALVNSLNVVRLKAVLITDEGIAGINSVDGELSVTELDDVMDSRIEVIATNALDRLAIESQLLQRSTRLTF